MRITFSTLMALSALTLGAAIFFVHITETPRRLGGPLLEEYAAAWRTAQLVDKRHARPSSPPEITIINATPD
jgi:hypothetical protein